VKLIVTAADSLSANENVVPTGALLFLLLIWASFAPSRQRAADWLTFVSDGSGGAGADADTTWGSDTVAPASGLQNAV
jgi:hypothetical protein